MKLFIGSLPYNITEDELNELYVNITAINAGISNNGGTSIADTTYWSSSEDGSSGGQFARTQDLNDGSQGQDGKNFTYSVRAVRCVSISPSPTTTTTTTL